MVTKTINAELLKNMFLAGAASIEAQKEYINDLNVFPVPDGDTGTNMSMTIMAAAKEVNNLEDITMEKIAKAISSGSLRGARGNSGVILSQLFRGFTKTIKEHNELDASILAQAFDNASKTAYKAVMKPKEGTILTVSKGLASKALEMAEKTENLEEFIAEVIAHGDYVLSKTPEMLPVLKEAGVVDSGGQGLMEILKGAQAVFLGQEIDFSVLAEKEASVSTTTSTISSADITFGYCTEFIIMVDKEFKEQDEDHMKEYLSSIGDSIVCVADEDVVKIHVHTNDPGLAIQKALTYGSLTRMKIDNMREEHEEQIRKEVEQAQSKAKEEQPRKDMGFIAVSIGAGMNEIFRELGIDYIIEGGQTMNPSTEDMLNAIDEVNADTIFILPNNKNIILAANQAQALTKDKNIVVIPTTTVPQGISAIINFAPEASVDENEASMNSEISNIKTGQVTYAVRDTKIDDKEIFQGNIMGIGDKGILSVGKEIEETTLELINALADEDSEFISIYYGQDVTEEDASALAEKIENAFPEAEVDVQYGGQPIYYYVLSVE